MDVKCCHRYLSNELLSAYTRPGLYGGSLENRSRFLRNAYAAARSAVSPRMIVTSRMNAYDGFPYPYGFGVNEDEGTKVDLTEAKAVVRMLRFQGLPLLNITIGNPYVNPHVNRPYDRGNYVPEEHPLVGESRMMRCVSELQKDQPDLPIIGSAFSYLRQYSPALAAGMVGGGHAAMAG
nr:flavin oxidoreductase/NADH oxidase [Clostridia bacterium]